MSQYQSTMKENKDLSELVIRLEKDAADCQAELTKPNPHCIALRIYSINMKGNGWRKRLIMKEN